jgi:hypothetical protein|tara:strand:+ start:286 stop:594 length:309 start_codon:yes stop_codon:yes gene_type:complete
MIDIWQAPEEFSRIVHVSEDGSNQIRLTVNTFRGKEYLHLRKYYMSFEEDWLPTKDGISMPLDLTNSYELFTGLVEILSLAESRDRVLEYFQDAFNATYNSS